MTDMKTTISKTIIALAGLLFLALCWNAYRSVGGSGFDNVLAEPWGLVTLADVMLGGMCMGVVIFAHEKQKRGRKKPASPQHRHAAQAAKHC